MKTKERPKVKLTTEQRRQENIKFILDNQGNIDELADEEYKCNFTNENLQAMTWYEIKDIRNFLEEGLRISDEIYQKEQGKSE